MRDAALLPVIALLLGAPGSASAATRRALAEGWLVDQWTTADGLPVDHATDVAFRDDGYVWIATFDGLVRFDGVAFHALTPDELPGLRTRRHQQLDVHPEDGALWILSDDGRSVSRLAEGNWRVWDRYDGFPAPERIQRDAGGLWLLTHDGIYALTDEPERRWSDVVTGEVVGTALDPDGTRWVATARDGIVRLRPDGAVDRLGTVQGVDAIGQFLPLRGGSRWLLPQSPVGEDGRTWDGTRFRPSPGIRPPGCAEKLVLIDEPCPPDDPAGTPWQVSTKGVYWDGQLVDPLEGTIHAAAVDGRGDIWLAMNRGGLQRVRRAPVQVVRSGAPAEQVDALYVDELDRLWLRGDDGWWTSGPGGPISLVLERAGPVGLAAPWKGYLHNADGGLFGTDGTGLLALTPLPGEAVFRPHVVAELALHDVRASHLDPTGRRWLGDATGLFVQEGGAWRERLASDGARIGGVRAFADDPGGGLLLAIYGRGLLHLDPVSGVVTRLDGGSGALTDNVRHVRLDGEWLWASTEDAGLCAVPTARLHAAPVWRCAGLEQGLPAPGAHLSVLDELGRVWVSTNRGIGVAYAADLRAFAAGEREDTPFLRLDTTDGLADAEGNGGNDQSVARDATGRLWFATQRGAVGVNPATFQLPGAPAARFEGVSIGEAAAASGTLALASDHAPLRVRWSAPESIWADQVVFRTRLGGGPWRRATGRSETLASLPAGPFTFDVQAGIAGAWGPIATLRGSRQPRLVERPGFPLALAALGVLATAGLAHLRTRSLRVREARLQAEVRARTADLSASATVLETQKDRLAEQAARLAQLDELRTRMIVNLHHELRTPLALIVGPLDDLAGRVDAAGRRSLDLARRNAEQLGELMAQLFDVARLESGELPLRASRADLAAFCRRTVERYAHLADQRGVALRAPGPGEPVPLWFDPDLLEKVVSNLVHNALKFTPAGGRIRVSVTADSERARVEVADTGPGVPAEERPRVFERLYQGDRGDGRRHAGAGIGLALAKDLVELHGGAIGVDPAEGGGSAFWFTLPRGATHLGPDEVALERAAAAGDPGPEDVLPEGPEDAPRVLVVEDHPDMRAFLASQLSEHFRVTTACDGAAGLAAARAERPSVVVTDVMMPGMTGLELARALRAAPTLADVPVLMLSAKTAGEDRVAGLAVADDYLDKPFRIAELLARVGRLVRVPPVAHPSGDASAAAPPPPRPLADQRLLGRLEAAVDEHLADPAFGVVELARAVAMSERTLRRELHRLVGAAPATWLRERRLGAARRMLAEGTFRTVGEVAAAVGMSRSYFSRVYLTWAGEPPGEGRGGGG